MEKQILAGGGDLHSECEEVLLEEGSSQRNIWGVNWYPRKQTLDYESVINIRVRDNNRSMDVQSVVVREKIQQIVQHLLGDLPWQ